MGTSREFIGAAVVDKSSRANEVTLLPERRIGVVPASRATSHEDHHMCLADVYKEREPLPALITFPVLSGIQDVMGFRLDQLSDIDHRVRPRRDLRSDLPTLVCSAGIWEGTASRWKLRAHEREYCRVVRGSVRIHDQRGRQWEFVSGSAFLLLRGFEGVIEVAEPAQIVYMVFSLPEGCALDWCMVSEGRTALGQERVLA